MKRNSKAAAELERLVNMGKLRDAKTLVGVLLELRRRRA